MFSESQAILVLIGLIQVIVLGLGAWQLTTTIKLQSRMTKVETLLEASLLNDVADLKSRISKIETRCIKIHPDKP